MPKYLTYEEVKKYYELHGCKLAFEKNEFPKNVTLNSVRYICPNGHKITNLTKNDFNNRINQNLGVCAKCSISKNEENRINTIKTTLENVGAEFVSKNKRQIYYKCKCGKECHTNDNNILKKNFGGCFTCQNPFNKSEIQEQIKKTNLEKYGSENVMHNQEIYNRSFINKKNVKTYKLPSGREVYYDGYENYCIEYLLKYYNEDEIKFQTEFELNIEYYIDNRKKVYYPDFYISKDNLVIEVKSSYMFFLSENKNIHKFKATIDNGYRLKLYIFNDIGNLILNKEITIDDLNNKNFDIKQYYNNILENKDNSLENLIIV